MSEELVIEILQKTAQVMGMLALPPLLSIVVIGLITQVIQNVTQLKDQALAFAPKLFITGGLMVFLAPWYLQIIHQYCNEIFVLISQVNK